MPLAQERFQLDTGWTYSTVRSLLGGLNTALTPSQLAEEQTPAANNVVIRQGRLEIDTGYAAIGNSIVGTPRRTFLFERNSGSIETVLVTNTRFYEWSTTNADWELVSNGTSTTVAVGAVTTDLTVDVADITGFTDGEPIAIRLDDGTLHETTIDGSPAGATITIDDAFPSAAGIGNAVFESVTLTGTDPEHVTGLTVPWEDWFVFTNNNDNVQRFDGTDVVDVPGLTATTCKALALFANRLLLIGTTESGTAKPYRVRYCALGNAQSWPSDNFDDTFTSGAPLIAAAPLGPYMILYRRNGGGIVRYEDVGSVTTTFQPKPVVAGHGALSPNSVISLHDRHLVFDSDGIYEYTGGFTTNTAFGARIQRHLFDPNVGDISPQNASRSFAFHESTYDEVFFCYPAKGSTWPNRAVRYQRMTNSFLPRSWSHTLSGFGFFKAEGGTAWDDMTGTWDANTDTWDSQAISTTNATIVLCGSSALVTYEYDLASADDAGLSISFSVESKSFVQGHKEIRVDRLDQFIRGTSVTLEYSLDQGATWTTWATMSPGASFDEVTVANSQFIARDLRWRWSGTGGTFGLEWFGFLHREERSIL